MDTEKQLLEKMLMEAENELTQIEGHVNYLRKKLDKPQLPSRALTQATEAGAGLRADAFFGMTIKDAIIKYLNIAKVPKSNMEMDQALSSGGLEHNSKSLYTTIASILSRGNNSEFVKIGKNWGLLEWYPNRKAKAQNGNGADEEVNLEEAGNGEAAEQGDTEAEKTARKKK